MDRLQDGLKGLLTKVFPVLKDDKGDWVRNPQVITDKFVDNGEIVYGEYKTGDEFKQARAWVNEKLKNNDYDFSLLDAEVNRIVWIFANLFPGCLDEIDRRHQAEEEILLGSR